MMMDRPGSSSGLKRKKKKSILKEVTNFIRLFGFCFVFLRLGEKAGRS